MEIKKERVYSNVYKFYYKSLNSYYNRLYFLDNIILIWM